MNACIISASREGSHATYVTLRDIPPKRLALRLTKVLVALDAYKDLIVAAYSVGSGEIQNLGTLARRKL